MIESRINHLNKLKEKLSDKGELNDICERAFQKNKWFIKDNVLFALDHINQSLLSEDKLKKWMGSYDLKNWQDPDKTVGQIMAGNLPLVGFHDFLCAYILGFKQEIKLSSKDDVLLPYLVSTLETIDPSIHNKIHFAERLQNYDCVIATGSNNSHRYFEYYFRDKPRILRKNRNSISIVSGKESKEELEKLSEDIFRYFGFGCRNVSKVYLPKDMKVEALIDAMSKFDWLAQHSSYMNNYDYNLSLLILNRRSHLANEFSLWVEDESLSSPLSTVHYEYYNDPGDLRVKLAEMQEAIQCTVSSIDEGQNQVSYGKSQKPELWDYADNIDIIEFLTRLV